MPVIGNATVRLYGNTERFDEASARYRKVIAAFARRNFKAIPGFEQDDMLTEMLEVLWLCILKYDPDKGAKFDTYFYQSMRNRYADLVKHAFRPMRASNIHAFCLDSEDVRTEVERLLSGNCEDDAMALIEVKERLLHFSPA